MDDHKSILCHGDSLTWGRARADRHLCALTQGGNPAPPGPHEIPRPALPTGADMVRGNGRTAPDRLSQFDSGGIWPQAWRSRTRTGAVLERWRKILQDPAPADDCGGDVLLAQRRLRAVLLDHAAVRYRPARDLAAHMLLYLDDLPACWSIATGWLRAELGCHRVDTGFGLPDAAEYSPGFAEAKSGDHDVPSFAGRPVDNRDAMMQAMWRDPRPLVYADIRQDGRVSAKMRQRMSGAKTRSKFAWALRTSRGGYGLICADWTEHAVPVNSGLYDCFEQTVADVLSPVIVLARDLAGHAPASGKAGNAVLTSLTRSEAEVARLVARGLSYKEIARQRGRSFSTIDHQLRSIREKTGAVSTAALIHLLARSDIG